MSETPASGLEISKGAPSGSPEERLLSERRRGLRMFAFIIGGINLLAIILQILAEFTILPGWTLRQAIQEILEAIAQVGIAGAAYYIGGRGRSTEMQQLWTAAALFLITASISTYYDVLFLDIRQPTINPSWVCLLVLIHALLIPANRIYHSVMLGIAVFILPAGALVGRAFGLHLDFNGPAVLQASVIASIPTWICVAIAALIVVDNRRRRKRLERLQAELERLGSYVLETPLGKGGMGEVWKGRHVILARPVAIKLIRPELFLRQDKRGKYPEAASTLLARFEQEARATAALNSAHTINLFDFGRSSDGSFFYVMELLDGMDLQTLIDHRGALPQARVIHLLLQICDSLGEAHQAGLIHRDIKPANIFICRQGLTSDFVKVLDFGLVTTTQQAALEQPEEIIIADDADNSQERLTRAGLVQGTPTTMAPEQALGMKLDKRADIYAVGCISYHMLTGKEVFDASRGGVALMSAHVTEEVIAPCQWKKDIDPELESLILQMLEKRPEDRPGSMERIRDQLQPLAQKHRWEGEEVLRTSTAETGLREALRKKIAQADTIDEPPKERLLWRKRRSTPNPPSDKEHSKEG